MAAKALRLLVVLLAVGLRAAGQDRELARLQVALSHPTGDFSQALAPTNYNHPEPLCIWPDDQNGRGDVFASFSPTKTNAWPLAPGHTYGLRYRLLVFNGHCTAAQAESAWQYFAHPPQGVVEWLAPR